MKIVCDDLMSVKITGHTAIIETNSEADFEKKAYRHLIKADALRIKNCFWEAIDEYAIALENTENSAQKLEIYKGLALSYKQVGYISDAINTLDKARKTAPFDKTIYYEMGCCYCMDKKFCAAIKNYKKALKINPDYMEAKLNLALAYELAGQNSMAVKSYIKIIETHPDNLSAYNALGSLYIKLKFFTKAIKTFSKLLKISREYSRGYLGIAIAYDKMGNSSASLRYYKKYIGMKPNCGNLPYIIDRIKEIKSGISLKKQSHLKLVV